MRFIFSFLILLLCATTAFSQNFILKGKITDKEGRPVSFASIYIQNTTRGTSANSEGEYRLQLPPGQYQLLFKAIGYRRETRSLEVSGDKVLDVNLEDEILELNAVEVSSGGEDPAYEIIRKAIKNRKAHLNEVKSYRAEVYIKGLQKLLAAPKKFLGRDIGKLGAEIGLDSNRSGIIYLSESESRLHYMRPDNYREEMISSKVSGSNRAFSFNRASDIRVNFYENIQDWEGLSNRPFISPLAENALFYYRFKFIGSTLENGQMVNKIRVIPRRSTDPVFSGNIYILDESWRIRSVDLYMTKESNINFVDTLKVSQEFFPVGQKVWMPSSVKFDFTGGLFGFKFGGYYIAVYKNYTLDPDLRKKDFLETLKISREVNKKDSNYFSQARPVPLTLEERIDYKKKETLAAKRESKSYLDSLDKINNRFKPVSFIIGSGYNPRNRFRKENYSFSSLVNSVFYNTVEGFGINYTAGYSRQIDSAANKKLSLTGKLRYGFSSDKLYGSMYTNWPVKKLNLGFNIGSDVVDLNKLGSINQLGNSINSLFYERNFMKLYEKKFVELTASQRLFAGINASVSAEWAKRKNLYNTSLYSFINSKTRVFTSNNPLNPLQDIALFPEHQALILGLRASWDFSKKYVTYPSGRYYPASKYPRLGISYHKGFSKTFSSDVDYDLLSFDLSKSGIKMGFYGKSSFYLAAGTFLNHGNLYFPDFKHFVGNRSLGYSASINSFLFLDYYNFSTAEKYGEVHFEHNFSGFISNKLPLIRKLKLQELAGFNFLATPVIKNYSEAYVGLQYLSFRGVYGISYKEGKKIDQGFRISYGF